MFRSREQELEHLNRQLSEIKEALREISGRLGQIDRHVKRSFGVTSSAPGVAKKSGKTANGPAEQPTISPEQVRPIFDRLIRAWTEEAPENVQHRLQEMSVADLKIIAHELGLSFSSKPSRKSIVSRIIGRVNESVMLSRNSNLTLPRSEHEEIEPPREAINTNADDEKL